MSVMDPTPLLESNVTCTDPNTDVFGPVRFGSEPSHTYICLHGLFHMWHDVARVLSEALHSTTG